MSHLVMLTVARIASGRAVRIPVEEDRCARDPQQRELAGEQLFDECAERALHPLNFAGDNLAARCQVLITVNAVRPISSRSQLIHWT
jgi:hypothetical protein